VSAAEGPRTPDAQTTVVGVIGSPVRQSLSPLLHNAAFAALDLNWVSLAFPVAPGQVPAALNGMRALGVAGLSVTMPHKAEVATLVDSCSEVAAQLQAVNCVINEGGTLHGANTDGDGFLASLKRAAGFEPAGKRCLVIGAGGAARAVTHALGRAGAADVAVVNRTPNRAGAVAALAGTAGRAVATVDAAQVAQSDLVVNATPIGMAGMAGQDGAAGAADAAGAPDAAGAAGESADESEQWLVAPALLHVGQVVTDLVYAPRPTPWLAASAAAGATTVDGLGMLVHQAALQLELWTGQQAPVDVMWQAASAHP
jgi:shikimate dehydrogenase